MTSFQDQSMSELTRELPWIREAPRDDGILKAIVIRPSVGARKELQRCHLSPESGADGDTWPQDSWLKLDDGAPHPDVQIAMMNVRVIALLARDRARWKLAGDQLYVDFDLSRAYLQAGQKIRIGSAILEITKQPYNACKKFSDRFGVEALKFVSSAEGRALRLRGVYAKVLRAGSVSVGDRVTKIPPMLHPD